MLHNVSVRSEVHTWSSVTKNARVLMIDLLSEYELNSGFCTRPKYIRLDYNAMEGRFRTRVKSITLSL